MGLQDSLNEYAKKVKEEKEKLEVCNKEKKDKEDKFNVAYNAKRNGVLYPKMSQIINMFKSPFSCVKHRDDVHNGIRNEYIAYSVDQYDVYKMQNVLYSVLFVGHYDKEKVVIEINFPKKNKVAVEISLEEFTAELVENKFDEGFKATVR